MAEQIEACTTEARRKRHYCVRLVPDRHAPRTPGRSGVTLCGQFGRDEERANAPRKIYGEDGLVWEMVPPRKQIRVADLPECSLCCRFKAKLERESEVISGA